MPELPEVEVVRRYLEGECLGATITMVKVHDRGILDGIGPRSFSSGIRGRRISSIKRHGKQLFLELGGESMNVHLGMTGDLLVLGQGEPSPRHARLSMHLSDGRSLIYDDPRKFGSIGLCASMEAFVNSHRLGPDALLVAPEEFASRTGRSGRAIKSVLLDQHFIAGIGNLYADEVLFQMRVHPTQPADRLPDGRLLDMGRCAARVLQASIDIATDFDLLPNGYLLRSRKEGEECPRQNGRLRSMKVGGRTSYYCPKCQRPP